MKNRQLQELGTAESRWGFSAKPGVGEAHRRYTWYHPEFGSWVAEYWATEAMLMARWELLCGDGARLAPGRAS